MSKREEHEVLEGVIRNVGLFEALAQADGLPKALREECRLTAEYNRQVVREYQHKRRKERNK
jgi:hypothetical protein